MFHVLVHVNKLTGRYHDSNFRLGELSKNAKRPHFLWVSRPKPVARPEIMENVQMLLNLDRPFRKTSDIHLISCIESIVYEPKITWFQYELRTPPGA